MTIFERTKTIYPLSPRRAQVTGIERGEHFARIILSSDEFSSLEATGPTDHVKLVLPLPGESAPSVSDVDGHPQIHGTVRDMTIAAVDASSMTIDIARHADGAIAAWLDGLEPGEAGTDVIVLGPRGSKASPAAPHLILGADASAIPALNRWFAYLDPVTTRVDVLTFGISTSYVDSDSRIESVTEVDSEGAAITTALKELEPGSDTYIWLAGETTSLIAPRRWLRYESNAERANIAVDGYWKIGVAGRDHHEPVDPTDPS